MDRRTKILHFIGDLLVICIGVYILEKTDSIILFALCLVMGVLISYLTLLNPTDGWGKVFAKNTPRSRRLAEVSTAITGVSFNDFDCNVEEVKGNGKIVTHNYDVKKFDELSCALPAMVNYSVSDEYKFEKGPIWVLEIDIAGSGNIMLQSDVEYLDANIMGSGSITSKVNGPLKYYIVGSGNINYSGNAKLQGKTMGNGCVRQVTESANADGVN